MSTMALPTPYDHRTHPGVSKKGRRVTAPRITAAGYLVLPKELIDKISGPNPTSPLHLCVARVGDSLWVWRTETALDATRGLRATTYPGTGAMRVNLQGFLKAERIAESAARDVDLTWTTFSVDGQELAAAIEFTHA